MSVYGVLQPVKAYLTLDPYRTNSFMFSVNTKLTAGIVLVFCIVTTCNQYFGDPIDCMVDRTIPGGLMDTYCWIHSTFTLPQRVMGDMAKKDLPHPGLGPVSYGDETTDHKYYQWVVFTLFFQALLFYAPKTLWGIWEEGQVSHMIPEDLLFHVSDKRMPLFPRPPGVLKEDVINACVRRIRDHLTSLFQLRGVYKYQSYFFRYMVCEGLTLVNLLFQLWLMDKFLGGMFSEYGTLVASISQLDPEDRKDPMNLVFPKVAKCVFNKFGGSGTVEIYDGLCVLPINIFNEKIYIFMWFWLIILVILTSLSLVYHAVLVSSVQLRAYRLKSSTGNLIGNDVATRLAGNVRRGEWFFLMQLGYNLNPVVFGKLCTDLDKSLHFSSGGNSLFLDASQNRHVADATAAEAGGSAVVPNGNIPPVESVVEKIEMDKLA